MRTRPFTQINIEQLKHGARILVLLSCPIILTSIPAHAQFPRMEFSGGYSYYNGLQQKFLPGERNFRGGSFTLSVNPNRNIRLLLIDLGVQSGYPIDLPVIGFFAPATSSESIVTIQALFGPQFVLRRHRANIFAHTLVGLTNAKRGGSNALVSGFNTVAVSSTSFALGLGGGLEVNVNRLFAVRVLQADFIPARSAGRWENNFRLGVGVVVRLKYSE